MLLPILFFIIIAAYLRTVSTQISMGPLNVNLILTEACDGDKGYINIDVVGIDNDKKGMNFKINMPFDMDEKVSYDMKVEKIQNGEKQSGIFSHRGTNACEDYEKFFGVLWNNIRTAAKIPLKCPMPKGEYYTENFPYDSSQMGVEKFLYGHFLMTTHLYRDNELFLCHKVEFTNSRPGDSV